MLWVEDGCSASKACTVETAGAARVAKTGIARTLAFTRARLPLLQYGKLVQNLYIYGSNYPAILPIVRPIACFMEIKSSAIFPIFVEALVAAPQSSQPRAADRFSGSLRMAGKEAAARSLASHAGRLLHVASTVLACFSCSSRCRSAFCSWLFSLDKQWLFQK